MPQSTAIYVFYVGSTSRKIHVSSPSTAPVCGELCSLRQIAPFASHREAFRHGHVDAASSPNPGLRNRRLLKLSVLGCRPRAPLINGKSASPWAYGSLPGYLVLFNMKRLLRRLLDLVSQDSGST